ncbi:MAG: DinB family protein [Pyrinomonadaceae bacterium]|nr:DinB family protein [Pyrinomonadaceae bacterium]
MNIELSKLIDKARRTAEIAKSDFGDLTQIQLEWKPNAESWSVGQCFEHLIISNDFGFSAVKPILDKTQKRTLMMSVPFVSEFFGNLIFKAVQPEVTRKIKAPKAVRLKDEKVRPFVIKEFVESQNALVEMMENSRSFDLKKEKISSQLTDWITYNLFDTYKIVVSHGERHLNQARRVLQNADFPKSSLTI